MAWQLHYTSARSGPSGRAGFQFVAATPGLPPGAEATVAPYLSYRPPPDAPAAPAADEVADFPVAFSYDLAGGHALLVRCRYLGRDYSGRYGNFLAHTVVAEPGELEGVRPIELWRAACWSDLPAAGDLPELDDLAPGDAHPADDPRARKGPDLSSGGPAALDPGTLAGRLAAEQSYGLLARLLDEVITVLARGHGRVILVADDVEVIARWIAVVSYSLPAASAAALSFVTYTDDPAAAPFRLVGTTPAIWSAAAHTAPAFVLDPQAGTERTSTVGRYARTAADCWRAHDLAGLDALGELADLAETRRGHGLREHERRAEAGGTGQHRLGSGFDTAAALIALCRDDPTVTGDEQAAAAVLLRRHGGEVPAWVWRDLAPAVPRLGFELAAALCDLTDLTDEALAERCAARCVLLALTDPRLRSRLPGRALRPRAGGTRARLAPAFADAAAAASGLAEIAAIAAIAERCHVPLPAADVAAAAARCAESGSGDLLAAIDAIPAGRRDGFVAGVLAGLENAAPDIRAALLTDAVCDLVAGRDLGGTPQVALRVLGTAGRRCPPRRVELTRSAIALERAGLPTAEIDTAIRELWSGAPPTIAECAAVLNSWGPDSVAAALASYPALAGLPSRAFAAARDELDTPEVIALADRIGAMTWRDGSAATTRADAAVVKGYTDVTRSAARAVAVAELAAALDRVAATQASAVLIDAAFAGVAARLSARTSEFRESLLAALTEPARVRLTERLLTKPERRGLDRRKLFRRRGG